MAYNLPPPWDPGFALPGNVRDEGLERHAFVTKQAPRGTYDDPRVGDAGYAVPQYVKDEGYGQGARVSKWSPNGTVTLPMPPHYLNKRPQAVVRQVGPKTRTVTFNRAAGMAGLSGTDVSVGQSAAARVLAGIRGLTGSAQVARAKQLVDRIDPTAWARIASMTRAYVARGMTTSAAFQQALTAGLAQSSAMGCCGSMGALGAVPSPKAVPTTTTVQIAPTTPDPAAPPITGDVTAGMCSSDGLFVFVGTPNAGGYWTRRRATDPACTVYNAGSPTQRTATGQCAITYADGPLKGQCAGIAPPPGFDVAKALKALDQPQQMIKVGPWYFGAEGTSVIRIHPTQLDPDYVKAIAHAIFKQGGKMRNMAGGPWMNLEIYLGKPLPGAPIVDILGHYLGDTSTPATQVNVDYISMYSDLIPQNPVIGAQHPVTGEDYGVFLQMYPNDHTKPWDSTTNPMVLQLTWQKWDKSWYAGVWDWITHLVATVEQWIGKEACAAAQAIKPGAGVNPYVAAAAAVGSALCGSPTTPPSQTPPLQKPSLLVPLMIGGGLVMAALLFSSRKKKTP